MKRYLLPALAFFLVVVLGFGFWWLRSGEWTLPAEKAGEVGEIEDRRWKMEDGEVDVELSSYLLTPGPVRRKVEGKEVVTSVNGRFIKLENIPNSKDKYLFLDGVEGKFSQLRIVGEKRPEIGLNYITQLSVISAYSSKGKSISSRLREVGYFDSLSEEKLGFFLRPNVWLKAILYLRNQSPMTDRQGHYYVLAVSVNETL